MTNEHTMNKYNCHSFRTVRAHTIHEAAEIFARRAAQRQYGRTGYARTCTPSAYTQDGTTAEFSCFIGYTTGPNETTGHNIVITVQRA